MEIVHFLLFFFHWDLEINCSSKNLNEEKLQNLKIFTNFVYEFRSVSMIALLYAYSINKINNKETE